jgi:hypothetical protein
MKVQKALILWFSTTMLLTPTLIFSVFINKAEANHCGFLDFTGNCIHGEGSAGSDIQPIIVPPFKPPSTAYFAYRSGVFWYRKSVGGYCGITSPTHLKVLQITDPAPVIGCQAPTSSEFGRNLGVCPPYAFYFNYGGAVRHFSSNRGGYCAFTSPNHLRRFQQSNPAISLGNQTPRRDFGKDTGVCP